MSGLCSTFSIMLIVILPFVLLRLYRRVKLTGSLITREEYESLPDGGLRAGAARFDPVSQTLEIPREAGARIIPFADIHGIQIQVRTSRKIHLSLLLTDTPLPLSIVTNHDFKLAGINAHRVAEVVAGDGEGFLRAFREFRWSPSLIGSTFEYRFASSVGHHHHENP